MSKGQRVIKKIAKTILYLFLGLLGLILLFLIFINTSSGKRFVRNKTEQYLREKLAVKVEIGSVDYSLPKWIQLKDVFIGDKNNDTLISGAEIAVDLKMLKLLKGETDIQKVVLNHIIVRINRSASENNFNYQFLIDAFATGGGPSSNPDTSSLKINLDKVFISNTRFSYNDDRDGVKMQAGIDTAAVFLDIFQPDKKRFAIQDLFASAVDFSMLQTKPVMQHSGKKVNPQDNSTLPLMLTLSNARLKKIHTLIDDRASGMYSSNAVEELQARDLYAHLETQVLSAREIFADSAVIVFTNPITNNLPAEKEVSIPWRIHAGALSLKRSSVKYDDLAAPVTEGFDVAHFDAGNIHFQAEDFLFNGDSTAILLKDAGFVDKSGFILDTAHAAFVLTKTQMLANEVFIKTGASLLQRSLKLEFDSLAAITKNPVTTRLTALIGNSVIAFNDLYLVFPFLSESLPKKSFANQYVSLNTGIKGNLQQLYIPSLQLSGLSGSSITARATLFNLTDAKKFRYELDILQSRILRTDLAKFLTPEQLESVKDLPETVTLNGNIKGDGTSMQASVNAAGKGIAFSGTIQLKGFDRPDKIQYDLSMAKTTVNSAIIASYLPPNLLEQIKLPATIAASGELSGNLNDLSTNIKVSSTYGPLSVKGYIRKMKDPVHANYDLVIATPGFKLGTFLKKDSVFGLFAGEVVAKGAGYDYKTMQGTMKASVNRFDLNSYSYKNLLLDAEFRNGLINSKGSVADSNLTLQYLLSADVRKRYPAIQANVVIDTAQLANLKLYDSMLNLSGSIRIDASSLEPHQMKATVLADSLLITDASNSFRMDSVSLIAASFNGSDSFFVNAPFAQLKAGGNFEYDQLPQAAQAIVNKYYKITSDSLYSPDIFPQQFGFEGQLNPHPFFNTFIPGFNMWSPVTFSGVLNNHTPGDEMNLSLNAPGISYNGIKISNAILLIDNKEGPLKGKLTFDTLQRGSNLFYGTGIYASAADNRITLNAQTKDERNIDWFGISGHAVVSDDVYRLHLTDSLLLNYEKWNATPDNYIEYSPRGIVVNNFDITSDTARIFIRSDSLVANSPLAFDISNFNLKSISSFINRDTAIVAGILNMQGKVSELDKPLPAFTGNANVKDLAVMNHIMGNLSARASKQLEDEITAIIQLNGNDVSLNGNYFLNDSSRQFRMLADIRKLNVKVVEAFSAGQIINSEGNVHGSLDVSGSIERPVWNGAISFDSTRFTLSQLGSPYFINDQSIRFDYPGIKFDEFIIRDSLNHNFKIDGQIRLIENNDFALALDMNAYDFILLNARKSVNNQFYGYAAVDAYVSISGTSVSPNIEGDIFVIDKSNVSIVLPDAGYTRDDGNTIVKFVDIDTFSYQKELSGFIEKKKAAFDFARYLNYNLNVEINKSASLQIVIDPSTGDEVKVQGDAQLNAGVDPGGNLLLAGNYELDKGYYILNYQFLQRQFNLIKGSTITFAGAPEDASIRITAEYIANTSARELLSSEITDLTPQMANALKQKLPFRVLLYLSGNLTKPTIGFDIQLPDQNNLLTNEMRTTIENKLQQMRQDPASTNKQVFSLLLLNRFIGEQSADFFKGNGTDFSDLARRSVSQFLSSALNEIAEDIFKGIDIDLNLNSYNDFTKGGNEQRTDLNVAVTKSFFNDRLSITVGKNFGLAGQDPAARAAGANNVFRPDVSLAYKLTSDGKYMVRAYTKTQFEVVLDGYIVENGVSFMVTMDYDRFRELFRRKK